MRAPLRWLAEYVALPADIDPRVLAHHYVRGGLEVEGIEEYGADLSGPIVVGRVVDFADEPQRNGKIIRWCSVDVGAHNPEGADHRGIVCGAHNFAIGDLVVVALPGAVLAGGFEIAARKTYGHVSDGMICAEDELGIGTDHTGIIVLAPEAAEPGAEALPVLDAADTVLDIDITPDMSFCMSIRGLAREAAQHLGVAFTDPARAATPAEKAEGQPVRLDDPRCTLFAAVTVTGIDPSRPTPDWMRRRLHQCGVRSISLAVDVTNYVMLEIGQPLHGYDADRVRGTIVVRAGRDGETLTTLDDKVREVGPADLLITDDSGPIGLAGVMGGASTEISAATTSVVLEAATFDPVAVSRTSRRLGLTSEASRRFERGVDPGAAYPAARRAADLLARYGGGQVAEAETVVGGIAPSPSQQLPVDLPARILGIPVPAERVVEVLTASGVDVTRSGDTLTLVPPSWRGDLRDTYDYVEEVGQKVGLDLVPSVLPIAPPGRGLTSAQRARRDVRRAVAVAGFVEVLTFPFVAADDLDRLQVPGDDARRRLVRLANPLAETQPYLRTTLLSGLAAAAARNTSRGLEDLALWEAGSVFRARPGAPAAPRPPVTRRPGPDELAGFGAALPEQPRHLAALVCGDWAPPSWSGPARPAGWQHAIAFADVAARAVGVRLQRRAAEQAPWHPGRCAELLLGEVSIGWAGELHPSVCTALGLPARTAAVELDLDALTAAAPGPGEIPPLSSFPVAKEDVALVVSADVPAETVAAALRAGAGELCESVRLFDVYTGDQIPAGTRSLAFALRLRAADRTLTDAEAAAARDAAVAAATAATGAVLRA